MKYVNKIGLKLFFKLRFRVSTIRIQLTIFFSSNKAIHNTTRGSHVSVKCFIFNVANQHGSSYKGSKNVSLYAVFYRAIFANDVSNAEWTDEKTALRINRITY